MDGVDNRQSGTFYLPRACFLSPVVTLRTHSLFSITINIVGLLIFGSEWGTESNHYFQFWQIVTFSWKCLNNPTHCKLDKHWKTLNIESNIVFLQCPNISLSSCQDFPGECVECGGDPDPISSISLLTLLTYFTTIPTLHTKHVSSGLAKKSVVFISNQPVWPCPMTKVCYKPGRPDKTKGGSVAQLALLRYLPTHFPNSSDLQRPLLRSGQLGIG